MNWISGKTHGLIDYIIGAILISLPVVFNFNYNAAQKNIPVIIGIITIAHGLLTNYKYGPLKLIPIRAHLIIDGIIGLFLILSPWLYGFERYFYLPHLCFGVTIILIALFTDKVNNQVYF